MKRIRVEKSKNFTTINNEFIFNKDLSLKAKGMLCHLLALPNEWKLYVEEVEKWHKDGKKAIYSAFKELTENGYMKREQIRDNGKFKGYDYVVYEVPYAQKRNTEKRYAENGTLLNTNTKLNTNITKTERDYPFELNLEAWKLWKEFRRKEFRTSYKTLGENAAIKKLLRLSDGNKDVQAEIIQQSMENSWKGLFAVKSEKKRKVQEILTEYEKGLELLNQQFDD
jgi:predicted transcriptional regulator